MLLGRTIWNCQELIILDLQNEQFHMVQPSICNEEKFTLATRFLISYTINIFLIWAWNKIKQRGFT